MMHAIAIRSFAAVLFALIPPLMLWAQAAVAASDLIVDSAYVAEALKRNAIVWDVRPADAYAKGHIAGAISIGNAPKVLRDDNTEDFIALDRIEKLLGAAGLDPKREIIIYGSRGTWNPYFGLYTIQYLRGDNARVYHEGIEGWTAAGGTVSREPAKLPPRRTQVEGQPSGNGLHPGDGGAAGQPKRADR
ncbi:MAG: rhodanese-like domain-containing protein [Betaproteobacteria bacterium]